MDNQNELSRHLRWSELNKAQKEQALARHWDDLPYEDYIYEVFEGKISGERLKIEGIEENIQKELAIQFIYLVIELGELAATPGKIKKEDLLKISGKYQSHLAKVAEW